MLYIFYIALFAAFLWAISSVIARRLAQKFGNALTAFIVLAGYALMLVLILVLVGNRGITPNAFIESASAGLFIGVGYVLVFKTLETENAGNTFVFTELQVILLLAFGVLVLKEQINALSYV